MATGSELKQRHADIKNKLVKTATRICHDYPTIETCKSIAKAVNVSYTTVYNYSFGRIKDGYLAEAILKEYEKL